MGFPFHIKTTPYSATCLFKTKETWIKIDMELKGIFITVLCFTFFSLQTPCTSLQSSNDQQAKGVELSTPTALLPRKLRFAEEVEFKRNEAQHSVSRTMRKKEDVSGKAKKKEHGNGEEEISHDFTLMDYSNVRRRRPIHNKSLPLVP